MHASDKAIADILTEMKNALNQGRYTFEERKKNMYTLATLGITIRDALEEMMSLTKNDYEYTSPDKDYPKDSDYWIFKKIVSGSLIYIKFKMQYLPTGKTLITSFHFDDMRE